MFTVVYASGTIVTGNLQQVDYCGFNIYQMPSTECLVMTITNVVNEKLNKRYVLTMLSKRNILVNDRYG